MTTITGQELLAQDVDILYLAALENQLNKDNMENVRAKIILEGANGPTTMMQTNTSSKKASISFLTYLPMAVV